MTATTATLASFLLDRLAEDEAEAREAVVERDRVEFVEPPEVPDMALMAWPDSPVPAVLVGPERVLAEVEAKRRLVEVCWTWIDRGERAEQSGDHDVVAVADRSQGIAGETVLRALASVYRDHPEWREEWA